MIVKSEYKKLEEAIMSLLDVLQEKLSGKNVKIVLPEGEDERVLTAATQLQATDYVTPVLLGNKANVEALATEKGLDLSNLEIIDPETSELKAELVEAFVERRKGKATQEQAEQMLKDVNYFGTMLVYTGKAEGLVSGAAHSTGDTVRPALQIIKTKPGVSKTSGIFFMIKDDQQYIFGDCAINPTLEAQDLAEIAIESAKSAQSFGMSPRVAMLSFSTKGSAKSDDVEKVSNAVSLAKEKIKADNLEDIVVDGEFQFDAAIVPEVAAKKAPGAQIQGDANVFVFPSLEAGNIGYKIAQRLGGFDAVGPVLQGLNSPVNDLSRGCSTEDVYNLSIITAAQTLQ
jgi:phosphate acetyltransferase